MKKSKVSFCPKCKSTNVKYVFMLKNLFGVIPKQRCLNCGFEAVAFPFVELTDEQLKQINSQNAGKN